MRYMVVYRQVVGIDQVQLREPFDSILQADEQPALFALAVYGDWVARDNLRAEAETDGPEVVVKIDLRFECVVLVGSSA